MERFQMFLPGPILKRLRALAKRRDVPIAELIRAAIEKFLTDEGA